MAITKSAKKALRQSKKRRVRNIVYKDKLKSTIKEVRTLVLAKKVDEARKLLSQAYKVLDKSAKVGVIKKNVADRKKSRLSALIVRTKAQAK